MLKYSYDWNAVITKVNTQTSQLHVYVHGTKVIWMTVIRIIFLILYVVKTTISYVDTAISRHKLSGKYKKWITFSASYIINNTSHTYLIS